MRECEGESLRSTPPNPITVSVSDQEPGEASWMRGEGRAGHQGQPVLPEDRLGEDRRQGDPAAVQTQNRE